MTNMNKMSVTTLLASSIALFGAAATAQPPPEGTSDSVFFVSGGAGVMPFGGPVDIIAGEGSVIGEVVVAKPYSADSVTESTQILADGNRITHTNKARISRDSQGRTRREHILDGVGVWQTAGEPVTMVMINDPVNDVSYFLDPRAQTARELKPFKLETMPLPPGETGPGEPGVALQFRTRGGLVHGQEDIAASAAVPIDGAQFDTALPLPPPGALPMMATRSFAFGTVGIFNGAAGEAAAEDLGEQVLEGVLARGTRQTQTIPAGAIGNEQPIEIVQEQWHSPDLEAIVLRRNIDPRFGETVYRLINVDRSEPAPELFSIPQGYDLQSDQGPQIGARRTSPPGPRPAPIPGAEPQRFERRVFLVQPEPTQTDGDR